MFRTLKAQLFVSALATIAIAALGIWGLFNGYPGLALVSLTAVCVYIILIVLWFLRYVSGPIQRLSDFAQEIADGSYGRQLDWHSDNELGRLTGEINNMSEKVASAEKSRTEFISQVSHELRTALTAITGWAETIAYDPAVQGDSLRGIQIISREAERLTNMVKELLEFTRIQDGRFNLRIEQLDIAAELEDALFTYGELMRQAGMEVNYTPPETEIPMIPGDPERLKQVFLNLLDNAATHGGDGKEVDVGLSAEADGVHITVRDHGRGIPEAELPHVKEKFYKGSSKNRGNGIGLAVCDEIAVRHRGRLEVANAPEGGCLVTLVLPFN